MSQTTLCALRLITQLGIDTARFERWKSNNLRSGELKPQLENVSGPESSVYESADDSSHMAALRFHSEF